MKRFLKNTDGATAIEYALICAVIVLIMLTALIVLGHGVGSTYNNTSNQVGAALG